jgi:hypothetical protein
VSKVRESNTSTTKSTTTRKPFDPERALERLIAAACWGALAMCGAIIWTATRDGDHELSGPEWVRLGLSSAAFLLAFLWGAWSMTRGSRR